ncbi:MAG: hypothetical protein HYZ28_03070 [Myxococcales bacterium]|nr:hypothetical protein [Myxococcales bacterium]
MGYGHLRPAQALANALFVEVLQADRPPLADEEEQLIWHRTRRAYELTSRLSQTPGVGPALRWLLDAITSIPQRYPYRDLSAPTQGALTLDGMVRRGLGRGLIAEMKRRAAPLLTTFYAPAIAADAAGMDDVYCVVTDSDINRVWVPIESERTRIQYLVPSKWAARRLRSYGVPQDRITFTGFPLPHELVGGRDLSALKQNLARRLVRLDPSGEFRAAYRNELAHFLGPLPAEAEGHPPQLTFAVGGAGAQAEMVSAFLPAFRAPICEGKLKLALVAGVRAEVYAGFREAIAELGMDEEIGRGIEILFEDNHPAYFQRFNELLARSDLLWTKPSELTFFGALGLPVVCAPPVGAHERYNMRWVRESGGGLAQRQPRFAAEWMSDWLSDGTLAGAAWSGFMRLPKFGLYQILEAVGAKLPR